MSLLLETGHSHAAFYPIGRVFDEVRLVTERRNRATATLGVVIQSATMTTGMAGGREAAKHFKGLIETLTGDT